MNAKPDCRLRKLTYVYIIKYQYMIKRTELITTLLYNFDLNVNHKYWQKN